MGENITEAERGTLQRTLNTVCNTILSHTY